eukprot:TRINITY_DN26153_c0_g1_i1.p1 TRINITY_DN26153_c0_g1~~TRINITY_DN26153_c0_g1_i1.p1  ORF type:complete len:757 (+),score=50.91 TRINITY_DN26153_c0_g1_i1:77-2347(+)
MSVKLFSCFVFAAFVGKIYGARKEKYRLRYLSNGALVADNDTAEDEGEEHLFEAATGQDSTHPMEVEAVVASFVLCFIFSFICVLTTSVLIQRFPEMLRYNALQGIAVLEPRDSFFGWMLDSWNIDPENDDVMKQIGLDKAMNCMYADFGLKVTFTLAVTNGIILSLLYYFCGTVTGLSFLYQFSVLKSRHGRFLFVIVGVTYVSTIFVLRELSTFLQKFVRYRRRWLLDLPSPQCTTVLVEGIPSEFRTDDRLQQYFVECFGAENIVDAIIVRRTDKIKPLWEELQALKDEMQFDIDDATRNEHAERKAELMIQLKRARMELSNELERAEQDPAGSMDILCHSGFVTFRRRTHCSSARFLALRSDLFEFMTGPAPAPGDVLWDDLKVEPRDQPKLYVMGQLCILVLYISFIPVCAFIQDFAAPDKLAHNAPIVANILESNALFAALSSWYLSSLIADFVSGEVPGILQMIYSNFYCLKSEATMQVELVTDIFNFYMVFNVMILATTGDIFQIMRSMLADPVRAVLRIFDDNEKMSVYHICFIWILCTHQYICATRYWETLFYWWYRRSMSVELAKKYAEPEDQDEYGVGHRTAKSSLVLNLMLMYSSTAPLLTFPALAFFVTCKTTTPYLNVFAETVQSESGGSIVVTAVWQIACGLVLSLCNAVGSLIARERYVEAAALAPLFFYICYSYRNITNVYWLDLAYEDLAMTKAKQGRTSDLERSAREAYLQPELQEDEEDEAEFVKQIYEGAEESE